MDKPPRVVPKPMSKPGTRPQAPAPGASGPQAKPAGGVRPPWYRRKYLVYPQFQLTLMIMNALITIALFSLIAYLVMKSHLYLETLVKQTRLPAQALFIQLLTQQLRSLLIYMFAALGVGVLTTVTFTLLISHRMAGPIIRLRNYFTQIGKVGDFPEDLKFRQGDFFQDLPPTINHALLALRKRWHK
ncbi:MAG: hypothetical protein EBX52_02080 [Proteobacteria bacterium]|nr:hypothetical protein [Pseudomonadota bacterium]